MVVGAACPAANQICDKADPRREQMVAMIRTAEAAWEGAFRDGQGRMKLGSGAFEGGFSYHTRMEEGPGTNPEELLAASHAGCFSMSLSRRLSEAGHPPKRIHTEGRVHFERAKEGYVISRIDLRTEAEVPGIEEETFQEKAEAAKQNCPVSKALAGVEIGLRAKLVQPVG
jgi:osmotically inducible protein OsmC